VNSQDFEFEKFPISKAMGLALHGLDDVVGPLQWAGRDRIIIRGQETTAMESQGLRATQEDDTFEPHWKIVP
jgi:hypothetical protein